MVDREENDKFDLGVIGLISKLFMFHLSGIHVTFSIKDEHEMAC